MYNQTKILPPIVNQQLLPAVTADTRGLEKSIQQAYSGTVVLPTTYSTAPGNVPAQNQVQSNVPLYTFQPVPQPVYQTQQVLPQQTPQVISQPPQQVVAQSHFQSTTPLVQTQPQTKYRLWQMLVPLQAQQPIPQPPPQPVSIPEPVTISQPVEIPTPAVEIPPEPVYTQTYEEPTPVYTQTYEEPTPVYEEPTYTIPETTTTTYQDYQFQTAAPRVQILRRGSGITANEQQNIISCASNIYQNKITPLSNKTAQAIKRALQGDWLVIVYEQGKPIDFNMTCVQGNDYLYFTLDNMAFQVCRLR